MNHTLKTYDDGSKLTVEMLVISMVVAAIGATIMSYAVIKISNWSSARFMRKVYKTS